MDGELWPGCHKVQDTGVLSELSAFLSAGIMGSLGFWPLTVFLPVSMHIAQRKIPRWSPRWIALQTLNVFW